MFSPPRNQNNQCPELRSKKDYSRYHLEINSNITPIFTIEKEEGFLLTTAMDDRVHYIGPYICTRRKCTELEGESLSMSKEYTNLIKPLKNKSTTNEQEILERENSIYYFTQSLSRLLTSGKNSERFVICSVPSSTPSKSHLHGPTTIAQGLAFLTDHIDGTKLVYRVEDKKPCHLGGARTPEEVVKGIKLNAEQLKDKAVLVLDDVVTTGANMGALFKMIQDCGVKRILCLSLSCSVINRNIENCRKSILEEYLLEELRDNETDPKRKKMFAALPTSLNTAFPLTPSEDINQTPFMPLKRARFMAEEGKNIRERFEEDGLPGYLADDESNPKDEAICLPQAEYSCSEDDVLKNNKPQLLFKF